jgi:hypothetical protein
VTAARVGALLGALALAPSGCGHAAPPAPARIAATDAVVRVQSNIPDAGLWIDGRFIGAVDSLRGGVALDPGAHRLEVRHEAYFVHYQELDLAPGQRLTLAIELSPVLP